MRSVGRHRRRYGLKLRLSLGVASTPRTWPTRNGQVMVDGIDLVPSVVHPSELSSRPLRFADFDVSEMSLSSPGVTIHQIPLENNIGT
jgi:hypothetical protein